MNERTMQASRMARLLALAAAILCASILAMGAFAQPAWAERGSQISKELSSGTKVLTVGKQKAFAFGDMGKVSAVKVSNSKVIAASEENYEQDGAWSSLLTITTKKAGTSKLTYKLGSKKHTVTIKVVKYQNPLSKLRVGSTNFKSKFDKSALDGNLGKGNLAGKLAVKPAKGWKLQGITLSRGGKAQKLKNGATITKSSGYVSLAIKLKNSKTGRVEECALYS